MKLYVTVVLALMANILFSQTMWDNPLLVRQGGNLEYNQSSVTTEDNGIIHVWSEVRNQDRDIFAMKFDNEGNSMWGQEPLIIDNSELGQANPQIIASNDGGYVIAWLAMDTQSYPYDVKVQKINSTGDILWQENGINIHNQYTDGLKLLPNDFGGAIVVVSGAYTKVYSLDMNGLDQWESNGQAFEMSQTYYAKLVFSDGQNGIIAISGTYQHENNQLVLKRYDEDCILLWSEDFFYNFHPDSYTSQVIYNNIDGYYLITSPNIYENGYRQINKLYLNGQQTEDQYEIPHLNPNPENYQVITNDDGYLYLAEIVYDEDNEHSFLKTYSFDEDLNLQWESAESSINFSEIHFKTLDLLIDGLDRINILLSYFINVGDYGESQNENLMKFFSLDSSGNSLTGGEGLLLSQNLVRGNTPSILYNDDIYLVWNDLHEGNRIFKQQVLDSNFQATLPEISETVATSLNGNLTQDSQQASYPVNNGQSSVIIWQDTREDSDVMMQMINDDGTTVYPPNGIKITGNTLDKATKFASAQNDLGQICIAWIAQEEPVIIKSRLIDSSGTLLGDEEGEILYQYSENEFFIDDILISSYENEFYLALDGTIFTNNLQSVVHIVKTYQNNSYWGQTPTEITLVSNHYLPLRIINNYILYPSEYGSLEVARINPDGTTSYITEIPRPYALVSCDSDNNLFFAWNNANLQVYVNGVTNSNELFWDNPVLVSYHAEYNDPVLASCTNIEITDGINIAWHQGDEVRMQKISYDGNRMWDQEGIVITNQNPNRSDMELAKLSDDKLMLLWTSNDNYTKIIKFNLINSDGSLLLGEDALTLTSYIGYEQATVTSMLNNNRAMVYWSQSIEGYSNLLSAQLIDFSSVENEPNDTVPLAFNLDQNYPNPFNPQTNISFQVNHPGKVIIEIYNIKGQKVKSLLNDNLQAGKHSLVWNGTNESGRNVASGIYFTKIKTTHGSKTIKMILMK